MRLVFLTQTPDGHVTPHTRWEAQAIAWSLAETGRFADPYAVPTGPTAHVPPMYPFLLSMVWRVFGRGEVGGYAGFAMGITFAALQCALLPWLAVRLGMGLAPGVLVGLGSAVLVSQWPPFVEPLAAVFLGLLMVAFRRRWIAGETSVPRSLLLGAAAGLAFHLQPVLVTVVAGFLAFELWWLRGTRRWPRTGAVALGAVLVCVPWTWRNYTTLDGLFFIRSNFGLELLVGNHDGAVPDIDAMAAPVNRLHPRGSVTEARRVREMGEVPYMHEAGARARAWITTHPAAYVRLILERALAFWTRYTDAPLYAVPATLASLLGVLGAARVLRRLSPPERAVLLIPLVTFPLVYYVVAYLPRYRGPVLWIVYLFAAAEVWHRLRGPAPLPADDH